MRELVGEEGRRRHMERENGTVAIFGLGYVGAVMSACLCDAGHTVIGVDSQPAKVEEIGSGRSPVVETGIDELMAAAVERGLLRATVDARSAVLEADVIFVTVGTPPLPDGSLDTAALRSVSAEIGRALRDKASFTAIAYRSTMLPGTCLGELSPILEVESGKTEGVDFGVCVTPEFLREGTAIQDFFDPPKVVIGSGKNPKASKMVEQVLAVGDAPLLHVDLPVAEMAKYIDNSWHALKVAFANEVGRFAQSAGLDAREVMESFLIDTKLNISTKYLRPGMAYGGSCLPKDVAAFRTAANANGLSVPVLDAIEQSNDDHIDFAVERLLAFDCQRVLLLGLSFKVGTDDVRQSPLVQVARRLLAAGRTVAIFEPSIDFDRLVGQNRVELLEAIPQLPSLCVTDLDEALTSADLVVIGKNDPAYTSVLSSRRDGVHVFDLVGLIDDRLADDVHGLLW